MRDVGQVVIGCPDMLRLLRRVFSSEYVVLLLTAIYVLGMWPIVPQIVSIGTLVDVLIAMMPLLVLAIGQTFVVLIAGIDLSIASTAAIGSVVASSLMTGDGGLFAGSAFAVPAGIATFLIVGVSVGTLNGFCVARLGMPSFIVTLVSQMFLSGLAVWFTSIVSTSVSIGNLPLAFTVIGSGGVAGVPYAFLLCAAVALGAHWVLRFTLLGKWLYAVGTNPQAARVSGVPVSRVVWLAFILSSFCAAVAAIIYTGRLETGTPNLGQRVFLDVIGAVVIGGVSLFGGKGKITWVIFGVLFLSVIDKGLQLLGVSLFVVFAVKGGVILAAAVLDALRNRLLVGGAQ
jgi:ribose/xylose/arabinose/galactoside ABC-type transport system permease subunit